MSALCECGHPQSHHYQRPRKSPSRVTMREDQFGNARDSPPGKCITFSGPCECRRFKEANAAPPRKVVDPLALVNERLALLARMPDVAKRRWTQGKALTGDRATRIMDAIERSCQRRMRKAMA